MAAGTIVVANIVVKFSYSSETREMAPGAILVANLFVVPVQAKLGKSKEIIAIFESVIKVDKKELKSIRKLTISKLLLLRRKYKI